MRQQSSIGPESSHTRDNFRAAPMRQQSDVFSVDEEVVPRKGRGKPGRAQRGRAIGEIFLGVVESVADGACRASL